MRTPELELLFPLITLFALFFGGCIGSFLNVVICRLPAGGSLISPPSTCPKCGHKIKPWENIPVISWLCLKGKCSSCELPISIRYPGVELFTAGLMLSLWIAAYTFNYSWVQFVGYVWLTGALIACSFIDIDLRRIPNRITYFGVVFGLLLGAFFPSSHQFLLNNIDEAHYSSSTGFAVLLVNYFPKLSQNDNLIVFVDSTGAVVLITMLLVFVKVIGEFFWGKQKKVMDKPVSLLYSDDKLKIEKLLEGGVAELKEMGRRMITVEVNNLHVEFVAGLSDKNGDEIPRRIKMPKGRLLLSGKGVCLKSRWFPFEQLTRIEGQVTSCEAPRTAIGWGDVKMFAMVAAFVGVSGILFVMFVSAVLGFLIGGSLVLLNKKSDRATIPYGPFIGVAAFLWLLIGGRLHELNLGFFPGA